MGASGTFNCSGEGPQGGISAGTVLLWSVQPDWYVARKYKQAHRQQKKSGEGERMSMGNVIKSLVQCDSDCRLKQPFVGKRLQDLHEPDD